MALLVTDLGQTGTYSGTVKADGTLVIPIKVTSGREAWRMEQVTIDMPDAPAGSLAHMRLNGRLVTVMIATGDAAGGEPPVPLKQGDILSIEWAGCVPGSQGNVLTIYTKAAYQ